MHNITLQYCRLNTFFTQEFIDLDDKCGYCEITHSYFESKTISVEVDARSKQQTTGSQSDLVPAVGKFACKDNLGKSSYLMGLLSSPE